jgi:hypothetical protein
MGNNIRTAGRGWKYFWKERYFYMDRGRQEIFYE